MYLSTRYVRDRMNSEESRVNKLRQKNWINTLGEHAKLETAGYNSDDACQNHFQMTDGFKKFQRKQTLTTLHPLSQTCTLDQDNLPYSATQPCKNAPEGGGIPQLRGTW